MKSSLKNTPVSLLKSLALAAWIAVLVGLAIAGSVAFGGLLREVVR